ncbi:MAG: acyltransferase [Rhizomicrobium sp.]
MRLKGFLTSVASRVVRRLIEPTVSEMISKSRAPQMIWGYRDCNGTWRPQTRISNTVSISHPEHVHIADNVFIWHYTILDGTGGLFINEGAQIGAWVGIFTHSSHVAIRLLGNHYQEVEEQDKPAYSVKSTHIGRYVFIGAGSKVMPGVLIGDGAIVSAGTIVTHSVPPFSVVAGDPGKIVGDVRKIDARYLDDPKIRSWYEEWTKACGIQK